MSAPALIDAALESLLSGTARSFEAQNKAAGRAGLGWPPGGTEPAPTIADLLPQDMLLKFLEVWTVTGANVLYTQAISLLATLEDGGAEAVARVSDSLEVTLWERTQALAAKWEGGAQA